MTGYIFSIHNINIIFIIIIEIDKSAISNTNFYHKLNPMIDNYFRIIEVSDMSVFHRFIQL